MEGMCGGMADGVKTDFLKKLKVTRKCVTQADKATAKLQVCENILVWRITAAKGEQKENK